MAFPSIPILADAVTEEHIPPEVRIAQSISHKEARDAWGSAFRRRWTINVRALGTEAATLLTHYESMVGPLTSFDFTCPRTGGTYLCRYETPVLTFDRKTATLWPATVSIVQVL